MYTITFSGEAYLDHAEVVHVYLLHNSELLGYDWYASTVSEGFLKVPGSRTVVSGDNRTEPSTSILDNSDCC